MTKGKKTTVPMSSVAADGEQSRTKNSNEIIANTQKQINLQASEKPSIGQLSGYMAADCPEKFGQVGYIQ